MTDVFTVKKPKGKPKKWTLSNETYRNKLRDTNKWQKELVAVGQEIGDLPPVKDIERRASCERNLELFCKTYSPKVFCLEFSKTHQYVIQRLQYTVIKGDQMALAMPRGSGKTSIMSVAAIWAILYGYLKFIVILGSSSSRAMELMEDIKIWIETNELLFEDFPEVCYPIRKLERITHRQRGQKHQGKPTRIDWAGNKLGFPMIDGSVSSGAVISASGMSGSDIRGQKALTPDGSVIRPDLVLIDDPQTRETAASPTQCAKRESIISGDVLGMAGPGKKIAAFCACTVISQGDLADRMLDRALHPEWHGERYKMLISEPTNSKLWEEYRDIYRQEQRNDGDGSVANAFYKANRRAMDLGAEVYWEQRHEPDELSALQNAMNLQIRDAAAFASEYQNEPMTDDIGEDMLTADEIAAKFNKINKNIVPTGAEHITAFIDVQKEVLFYAVCAWSDDFTGYLLDYGTYPDQKTKLIDLQKIKNTISYNNKGKGFEAALNSTLDDFTAILATKRYLTEKGQTMSIKLCLIDANWGESTDIVYNVCQRSEHANILMPAHGVYVGATRTPFSEYKRKRGERVGSHWRIPSVIGKRAIRHVITDVNYWKSFIHARLKLAVGDKSSFSLYGTKPDNHRQIADHLTAEYKTAVTAKGRTVVEWKIKPNHQRNDWFDCLVGCAVGASISGAKIEGVHEGTVSKKKKKISIKELQRQRKAV